MHFHISSWNTKYSWRFYGLFLSWIMKKVCSVKYSVIWTKVFKLILKLQYNFHLWHVLHFMQSRDIEMKLADRKAGDTARWVGAKSKTAKQRTLGYIKWNLHNSHTRSIIFFPQKGNIFSIITSYFLFCNMLEVAGGVVVSVDSFSWYRTINRNTQRTSAIGSLKELPGLRFSILLWDMEGNNKEERLYSQQNWV